ncbi:MAG: SDR family oxidoreductase [Phycisphaerales bacterium]|nr:SDR family oxidoreductase [Phycisphaerales bacterium]
MDLSLNGRRAVVCGSTSGLGRAAAIELALLGASVTLIARNKEKLTATAAALDTAAGQTHTWIVADFTDTASVTAAAAALAASGPHHILVNNTGGPPGGPALYAEAADYLAAFNAHLIANQLLTRAVVPGMKAARYGRIINIISTSVKAPIPNLGVSNTIRGAVAAWAKTLAGELGPHGITVNNVLPGFTRTERLASLVKGRADKAGTDSKAVEADLIATIPAGRFGEAHELGAAVAFLASPAAAYINGINLPVDGGRLHSL